VKLDKLALRIGRRVLFASLWVFWHSIHTLNIAQVIMVDKVGTAGPSPQGWRSDP
jgi:hypothetical protein